MYRIASDYREASVYGLLVIAGNTLTMVPERDRGDLAKRSLERFYELTGGQLP